MRLATWNVNGIRSCLKQGFEEWLLREKIDIACLQEVKASPEVLGAFGPGDYHPFWHCAEKPGYSGTAILTAPHVQVLNITYGMDLPEIDREGRVMCVELHDFLLVNLYAPHSQRELGRLDYKLAFCEAFNAYLLKLRGKNKPLIFTGDLNVAHHDIDLANPKANRNNAGFLPQERAWMDRLTSAGFVDAFRHFHPEPGHYTWWSQRVGVREKNIGWRIDYFMADTVLMPRVAGCVHQPLQRGSDHCPVILDSYNIQ